MRGSRSSTRRRKTGKILQVGSQGISSATQQKAREIVKAGRLGQITMIRASYNRNTAEGAWLYPIPPDASPADGRLGRVPGSRTEEAFQPGALLQVALLLGLLGRYRH